MVFVRSNFRQHIFPWHFLGLFLLVLTAQPGLLRSQTAEIKKSAPAFAGPESIQPSPAWAQDRDCPVKPAASGSFTATPPSQDCVRGAELFRGQGKRALPETVSAAGFVSFPAIATRPSADRSIEWGGLLLSSTKFLLFQHAFRLATESDTRAGLSGPFFRDYKDAVLNIHGWNDGDPFFVNYIDHPMEGSVAGFLEIAHDPRYRRLEIGKSSAYWKSRMRATAFSAAFSLEFEIGPLSEASIGNIQKINSKAGVVDWVITPVVGLGWMVGEDALDKYVVKRIETHTNNHFAKILVRGIFNPSRSFSNMMQGKVPWHRDTRPGVREGAREVELP